MRTIEQLNQDAAEALGEGGDLVDQDGAAHYIGRPVRTLEQWRYRREGPPYIKAGRAVRYSIRDLDRWLAAHRVDPMEAA